MALISPAAMWITIPYLGKSGLLVVLSPTHSSTKTQRNSSNIRVDQCSKGIAAILFSIIAVIDCYKNVNHNICRLKNKN